MPDSGEACRNCGAELRGPFCHRCGQEAAELRVPLRVLVADALGDLLAFDSRILRTLRPLFLRPGHLTAEWARGRRAPYVPPLRLYVFVAAVFFVVLAVTDAELIEMQLDGPEPEAVLETPQAGPAATAPSEEGVFDLFFERLSAAWREDPDAVQNRLIDRLGTLSLALPPPLALLLAVVYFRRRRFLVEHVVFSLHVHAFTFLLVGAVAFLPAAVQEAGATLAVVVTLALYLHLALRRVYGGRHWVTAARVLALGFGYMLLALLPTLILAFLWTVLTS